MDIEKTLTSKVMKQHINPYNAQHVGMREEQQDYFAFSDVFDEGECDRIGAVAILADGMGGLANGAQASRQTVDVFLNTYSDANLKISDMRHKLIFSAHRANEAVCNLEGAGSTLCAAVIKNEHLYWLSIGDSRIYLYRDGRVHQLNKEHNYESVLNEMVKKGEISEEEAINDPNRAALTSYIGIAELEEIDMNEEDFLLFKGDSILLCSDGLYRALSDDEIAYVLDKAADDVCDVLVQRALSKNISTQDNITVVLMDVD